LTWQNRRAQVLGNTLATAIKIEWKDPALEAFHRRFLEKFKDIASAEKPVWLLDYEYWVNQAGVW
jgi:hypothetical protein